MNTKLLPKVTLFLLALIMTITSFASNPIMQTLIRVSETELELYFNEPVQIVGTYTSGFTLQDCRGVVFNVQSISDGVTNDQVIELTVDDLSSSVGDLTLTYFNLNDPIEDLQNNVFDTDGLGISIFSSDKFEVTNASATGAVFAPAEESNAQSHAFNHNGTKLYVLGTGGDATINEYSLSSPYDITTSTFTNASLNVEAQDGNPLHVLFNPDGSRMYVTGFLTSSVYEYALGTNFDLSTASLIAGHAVPVSGPVCAAFNKDGSIFYTLDNADIIRSYQLSSPYDLTSLPSSLSGIPFFNTGHNIGISFNFNNDGTRLFTIGRQARALTQYDLSIPYDITTTQNGVASSFAAVGNNVGTVVFTENGDRAYAMGTITNTLYEFSIADVTGSLMTGLAKLSDNELKVFFDENVVATESSPNNFTVLKDGVSVPVDGISNGTAGNNEIILLFSSPNDLSGATIDFVVTYADPSENGEIRDQFCNPMPDDGIGVTLGVESISPLLTDVTINSSTELLLSFDEPIQITGMNADNFLITGCRGNTFIPTLISDPITLDNEILLTIPTLDFPNGDITITYTDPGNGAVLDLAGNVLTNFSTTAATSTDLVAPTLVGYVKISSTALELTYSEPVTAFEANPTNFSLSNGTTTIQPTTITDGTPEDTSIFLDFGTTITGTSLLLIYDNGGGNNEIADLSCNPVATDLMGVAEVFETVPPEIVQVLEVNTTQILVLFSEPVQVANTFGPSNISITDCDGNAIGVTNVLDGTVNDNRIELVTDFLNTIEGDFTVTINSSVNEIIDLSANNLSNGSQTAIVADTFRPKGAVNNNVQLPLSPTLTFPSAITFDDSGLSMYIVGLEIDELRRYQLTTPFDISTATLSSDIMDLSIEFDAPLGVSFSPDGTMLYLIGAPASGKTDYLNQYTLSTPFDITTAMLDTGYDTNANLSEDIALGINFNADGSKMFLAGTRNDLIYEFDLATNYDIATMTYAGAGETFNVAPNSSSDFVAFAFDPTGYLMYVQAQGLRRIVEYVLDAPFDVSTATYNGLANFLSFQSAPTPRGFAFSSSGDRLFILEATNDQVWQLDLADLKAPMFDAFDFNTFTQLDILFDEAVKAAGLNPGDLTFTDFSGQGVPRAATAIQDITASDNRLNIIMDLNGVVGDVVVEYLDVNTEISDLSCNPLAGGLLGILDIDQVAPTMVLGAQTGVNEITLTFSEPIQTNESNPADFTVVDGLATGYAVSAQQNGTALDNELILTVSDLSGVVGDLTITYTNNNDEISDFGGQVLASDSEGIVIDLDQTAPTIINAEVVGTNLINVTYSEPIQLRNFNANFQIFDGAMNELVLVDVTNGTANDEILTIEVTGLSNVLGDVIVSYINAGFVEDFGGNQANTNPGVVIDIDQVEPFMTGIEITGTNEITVSLSEPVQVNGVHVDEFEIVDDLNTSISIVSVIDGTLQDNQVVITVSDLGIVNNEVIVTYTGGSALITDFGGNGLDANTNGFTLDIVAPQPPVLTGIDSDTGESTADLITNDNTLMYVGTAEANSTVEVLLDGAVQASTIASASGSFVFDFTSFQAMDGVFNATFIATDATGNQSDESALYVVIIDTDAPICTSINRLDADGLDETTTDVRYEVTFDQDVFNVDAVDFVLETSGTVMASIGSITQVDPQTFTIVIENISGNSGDTFGLNLKDDDSINDLAGNALGGANIGNGDFTGQVYSFKTPQTITFDQDLTGKAYGDADFSLVATASSNLPVSFSATGPVSLNGSEVTILGAGETTITVSQPGNADFAAATEVTQTFTIAKATLAIQPNSKTITYGETLPTLDGTISGIVGSDNITASYATIADGNTSGAFDITATLTDPGNLLDNYDVTIGIGTLTIQQASLSAEANNQQITFGEAIPALDGTLTGVVNQDNITASYATIATTTSDVGTYPITVSLNDPNIRLDNYSVTLTDGILNINKANQVISFLAIADVDIASTVIVNLSASSNSGLDIIYTLDQGDGSISGNVLTVNATGSFTVTASQTGNANYNSAADVSQSFVVTDSRKQDQTITFNSIAEQEYGDPLTLGAIASSGLPVTYTLNTGNGTITNGVLTIEGVGTYEITASQSGDNDFNPAQDVTQTFTAAKATLTATADDQTINEGDNIPILTITYSGFKLIDDETNLDTTPTISTIATAQSDAGVYSITLSGGADDTYEFNLQDGMLNIEEVLGVGEDRIQIYPNPTTGLLSIQGIEYEQAIILSLEGKVLKKISKGKRINLTNLIQGQYILQLIRDDKEIASQTIVIKR